MTRQRRTLLFYSLAIFLFSFAFRLINLNRGMWADEITTYWIVQQPWKYVFTERLAQGHLPTYFYFVKAWTDLVGLSKISLRLPGVVAGAFASLALFLFLTRWFSIRFSTFASVLFTLNAEYLYASQSARMYGMTVFMEVCFFGFLLLDLEKPARRTWFAYAGAVIIGCLLHLLLLRLAFVALAILWIDRWTKRRRASTNPVADNTASRPSHWTFTRKHLRYLSPFLPAVLILPFYLNSLDATYSEPPFHGFALENSVKVFLMTPLGSYKHWDFLTQGAAKEGIRFFVFLTTGLLAFSALRRGKWTQKEKSEETSEPPETVIAMEKKREAEQTRQFVVWSALAWAAVPFVILLFMQLSQGHQIVQVRYLVGSCAAFAIVLTEGLRRLPASKVLRVASSAVVIALAGFFALGVFRYPGDGLRECLRYWEAHRKPREKTFLAHQGYWEMNMKVEGLPSPPASELSGYSLEDPTPDELASRLAEFAGHDQAIWILHYFRPPSKTFRHAFERLKPRWEIQKVFECSRSTVYIMKRGSPLPDSSPRSP